MASGTFYPAVSGDDGYWDSIAFYGSAGPLYFGWTSNVGFNTFVRFPNITIPAGSTISSVFIRFTAYSSKTGTVNNARISLNDVDDAVAPTDVASADALVLTTNKTDWNAVPAWTDGTTYDSADFASALQEVVDRGGYSSGNAITVLVKENVSDGGANRFASSIDYLFGAEKAELHVTWTTPITGEISEDVNVTSEFDDNFGELGEDVNVSSGFACLVSDSPISENVNVSSELIYFETDSPISEDVSVNSNLIAEHTGDLSEDASVNTAISVEKYFIGEISEDVSVNSVFDGQRYFTKTITDTLSSWDTLKWGWLKTVADSLAIAETVEKILGIPVKDWLTITDTEITNWNGTEAISDSFYAVDLSKAIQIYDDLIADGMAVAGAVKLALGLVIIDIVTFTDTALDIGVFQHSVEDGMTLEDIARRCFPKSISDSFAATDTSLVDLLILLQISDSLAISETLTPVHTINQTISDALNVLDVVAIRQLIQELIQDGLRLEVIVEIDGEIWECWVVNTSDFHISVYSGYDYNSFAIQNDTIYGCKGDGIYELSGDDDDGTAFKAGIILPATQFNNPNNKRFRKAYFGVSGDNLLMKMQTDSGHRTFRMTDTEMSLTRDLKGRKWKISLENFDELDFAELTPVILSKK